MGLRPGMYLALAWNAALDPFCTAVRLTRLVPTIGILAAGAFVAVTNEYPPCALGADN